MPHNPSSLSMPIMHVQGGAKKSDRWPPRKSPNVSKISHGNVATALRSDRILHFVTNSLQTKFHGRRISKIGQIWWSYGYECSSTFFDSRWPAGYFSAPTCKKSLAINQSWWTSNVNMIVTHGRWICTNWACGQLPGEPRKMKKQHRNDPHSTESWHHSFSTAAF